MELADSLEASFQRSGQPLASISLELGVRLDNTTTTPLSSGGDIELHLSDAVPLNYEPERKLSSSLNLC